MHALVRYFSDPSPCGYLPDQEWSLETVLVSRLSAAEYLQFMVDGWRRFGRALFRPGCATCCACRAIRVRVKDFRPDRSQRRCRKTNEGVIERRIGKPILTEEKLALYDRYHAHQAEAKQWPNHGPKDPAAYKQAFVEQPFAVEEWTYYLNDRLVGVGYVDAGQVPPELQGAGVEGLSAIYFFYDPEERHRSLGTWNVLSLIESARERNLPYLYLGYYVAGCPSMEYKPRFVPNEIRDEQGIWKAFRE